MQLANLSTLHHPPVAARQSSSGSVHSQVSILLCCHGADDSVAIYIDQEHMIKVYSRSPLFLRFCTASWPLYFDDIILFLMKNPTSNYRFKMFVGLSSQNITMFYQ